MTLTTRRNVIVGGAALIAAGAAFGQTGPAEIVAPAGRFVGERLDGGIARFRGIRYGRAERFRPARPEPRATSPVRATAFGPVCPQRGSYQPQDEYCLFLNIWTPAPRAGARRPVMLYIHGGAYSNGSVTDPLNDGAQLAARDAVVVTVNHRLNAFGYLYLARFDPRFADSGNLGQLDLILALQWVRDNIAAFGGDPARIMVFGQSGGGAKIATLLGMPAAKGLFHRAATMSGQQVTVSGPRHATDRARAMLAQLKVPERDLSALLAMPQQRIVEALGTTDPIMGGGLYMGPVLDMRSLDRHPFWPDAHPLGRSIPLILGNTHDETRAFVPPASDRVRSLDWSNVAERAAAEWPTDVLPEWIVTQYRRHQPDWSPEQVFYAATTAGRSWRGQVIEAEARAGAGVPAWVYQVDFTARTNPALGAMHTMDIPLVFGTLGADGSRTGIGADAQAASTAMQNRFVAFAHGGDPNAAGGTRWPSYELSRRATMIFDVRSRVEDDPRGWQRELFARAPYVQPGS